MRFCRNIADDGQSRKQGTVMSLTYNNNLLQIAGDSYGEYLAMDETKNYFEKIFWLIAAVF